MMSRMMTSKSMKGGGGGGGGGGGEMSGGSGGDGGSSKYARYTDEQVAILERVYNDCPKPSSVRRQQIIREFPILSNVGPKQLKVWFQNRRCREKQRKETGRLFTWNSKLNAMNQILVEENERLYKQATQLSVENQVLRQQLQLQLSTTDLNQRASQQAIMATTDTSSESVVTSGMQHQHSPQQQSQDASQSQLFAIAEKTLREFLVKATGNAMDWIQISGMKPGPDSVGVVAVSKTSGTAARSCGFVELEPIKVAEIVKNRPLWLQDCRRMEILGTFNMENGDLLELVHTQMYAPTTLAAARDFSTLRYTCCLKDGSLVVCERSLAAAQTGNLTISASGFIRGEILPSGCLIRPYEGGGSLVFVVDHHDYMAGGVIDVLHPLYESPMVLAQRMTLQVLRHLRNVARELVGNCTMGNFPVPSLQKLSHRLVQGFNDAVNCIKDDGWISLSLEGSSPVSVCVNRPLPCQQTSSQSLMFSNSSATAQAVLCAKASVLLQGVSPAMLVGYLREHRAVWGKFEAETFEASISRINGCPNSFLPCKLNCSLEQVLGPPFGQDELLEVIKAEGVELSQTRILQLCTGLDETTVGSSSQLVFATLDASVADDAPMLPSGFRMLLLDDGSDLSCLSDSLNLASSLKDDLGNSLQNKSQRLVLSALTMAFQFVFEVHECDTMALKARQYVQALLEFVRHAVTLISPRPGYNVVDGTCSAEAMQLIRKVVESYGVHLGTQLLQIRGGSSEAIVKGFWNLSDAIICCAWKPLPELVFANLAALDMLETNLSTLSSFSLERMFNDHGRKVDYSKPPAFLKNEGYARLPAGLCFTTKGRPVSFEHAIGWMVVVIDENTCIAAFMFSNWSIMHS